MQQREKGLPACACLAFTSNMSLSDVWPLFALRVRTPRLELRYPSDDDIAELAERGAVDGVHDPAFMPFGIEWTDVPPPLLQRNSVQHMWGQRANWQPDNWVCGLVCVVDGRVVGAQSATAENFAVLRTALTGSYLFLPEQGKGIGKEMRAAILHLLFAGLGAEEATSAAFEDNLQSIGVTKHLGYEIEGRRRVVSRGRPREQIQFRLRREAWETRRRGDITVEGLQPCLELFGLTGAAPVSTDVAADGS